MTSAGAFQRVSAGAAGIEDATADDAETLSGRARRITVVDVRPQSQIARSFLVRIWLELSAENSGVAMWRGHVTHLPRGRPYYFEDLDRMTAFLADQLQEMGISPDDLRGGGHGRSE